MKLAEKIKTFCLYWKIHCTKNPALLLVCTSSLDKGRKTCNIFLKKLTNLLKYYFSKSHLILNHLVTCLGTNTSIKSEILHFKKVI